MAERTMPAGGIAPGAPGGDGGATGTGPGPELIRRPDPNAVTTPSEFAAALSALHEQSGVALAELARVTGSTTTTLGAWLSGGQLPSPGALAELDTVLATCGVPAGPVRTAWLDALARVRRLPAVRPTDEPQPYRGLESYRAQDAPSFFGRERLVARLVALVTSAQVTGPTVLVGPSGSGKSSALQAGLAARLRTGSWEVVTLTPGARPLAALEAGLAAIRGLGLPPGSRVALLVDQLEEVFTLCADEDERREFLHRLTAQPGPATGEAPGTGPAVVVVLALRADFCAAALRYEGLAVALQDRQVVIGPMSADDLRRAVTEPARAAGVQVEPGLAELVLHDVATLGAAALPLMSFALLATWRRGTGRRLTIEEYAAVRGATGAVAATAETAYAGLTADQQELARRLFLRLVAVGDDVPDTLRPATAADLQLDTPVGDPTAPVLERFVQARLLTTTETTVGIAHEALLAAWPRLQGWLDAERTGMATRRRIVEAARNWQREGRDPAVLHRGNALVGAREWAADPAHLAGQQPLEQEFLAASEARTARGDATARWRTRRLRVLLVAVSAVAVLLAGLAFVTVRGRSGAQADRDRAVSRQLAETARRLRTTDPTVAAQVALQAWRTARTPEARSALLDASAVPLATRLATSGSPAAVAASADGHLLAAAVDGGVRVWSLGTGAAGAVTATEAGTDAQADPQPLSAVSVTRDGALLAAGGASGVLHLWDLTSGHPAALPSLPLGRGAILALASSVDGHSLAVATADGHVAIHDVHGTRITLIGTPLAAGVGAVQSVAFSSDSHSLAAGGSTGKVQVWVLADRAHPTTGPTLTGPGAGVTALAYSPDGHRLAAGSKDQHAYLWQPGAPAAPALRLDEATGPVTTIAYSPDGALLAVGGADRHLRVYETGTRSRLADLVHPATVTGASFLPDGHTLVSAATDGVLRMWPSPAPTLAMPGGRTTALGYLDGARLAAASGRDALRVFDVAQRYGPRALGAPVGAAAAAAARPGRTAPSGPSAVTAVKVTLSGALAVAPSGSTVAVGGSDGSVWLAEAASTGGTTGTRFLGGFAGPGPARVAALAFSPDGRFLAVGTGDGAVQLADVAASSPHAVGTPVHPQGTVTALAFSPDGRRLAVAGGDTRAVTLWDVTAPDHPAQLATSPAGPGQSVTSVAFSPDGRTLAAGSTDRTVRLLDVTDAAHPAWLGQPLAAGDEVGAIAFASSGTQLAAAGADGAVRLWDVADRRSPVPAATLTAAGSGGLSAVAFGASGRLAAAGAGTTVWQWDTDPQVAATRVCTAAGTPIGADEWNRYVPSVTYGAPCGH